MAAVLSVAACQYGDELMSVSFNRPLTSYGKVQALIGGLTRNRRPFIARKRFQECTMLNVGCGSNIAAEFINLDYDWRPGIDICWDITRGIPLERGSLAGIFTEHCLEHIDYAACLSVLRHFMECLREGGVLRIVVPDAGLYLSLYERSQRGEAVRFPYVGTTGLEDFQDDARIRFTPMMAVNRIFRGYGHLFAYDYETLEGMLQYVGFSSIRRESFRQGRIPKLLIDSELRAPQSLYIEASKTVRSCPR